MVANRHQHCTFHFNRGVLQRYQPLSSPHAEDLLHGADLFLGSVFIATSHSVYTGPKGSMCHGDQKGEILPVPVSKGGNWWTSAWLGSFVSSFLGTKKEKQIGKVAPSGLHEPFLLQDHESWVRQSEMPYKLLAFMAKGWHLSFQPH